MASPRISRSDVQEQTSAFGAQVLAQSKFVLNGGKDGQNSGTNDYEILQENKSSKSSNYEGTP